MSACIHFLSGESYGMNFVGIDPGVNGGMATLDYEGHIIDLCRVTDEDGIWQWAEWLKTLSVPCQVWIEKVSGYIGNAHPGSRMFEFGLMYGSVRMAVKATTGHLPREVLPADWQHYLQIEPRRKGGRARKAENRVQFKARLKTVACQLFPDVKITGATADALLIAYYARKIYGK